MRHIVIAGDRTVDWYFYPQPAADAGENWRLAPSMQEFCLPGGALLLEQLIRAALAMHQLDAEISAPPPSQTNLRLASAQQTILSSARLALFTGGQQKGWRVSESLGFQGPARGISTEAEALPQPPRSDCDLIVLDDHGNDFRNTPSAWPAALKNWQGQIPIIHKMRHPLNKGKQPDALWACLESKLRSLDAPPYVLVVGADDLRESEGVRISQGLSWERTAKEFLFQLKFAPALSALQSCPCIVVLFGWEGALVYRRATNAGQESLATLHFDSELIERGHAAKFPGEMYGMTSVFLATLISRMIKADVEADALSVRTGQPLPDLIDGAVPESLARARIWQETGFGSRECPSLTYPVETVFPKPVPETSPSRPSEYMFSWTVIPPVTSSQHPDPAQWRIVHQEWPAISVIIAMEYVRTGKAPGLQRSPAGVFGNLRTVDRVEIESFNAIRALVEEFLNVGFRKRPLCLGVFGPPGAGKSFGVEEVITSIGGERVAKLTFNVSQFTSEADLVAACHRIRDKRLEGKTPFVFFDEFDSAGLNGTELGWLRSFLALMQDGKFRDGEEMHPLGKCILVFAGGTTSSFAQFEQAALGLSSALKGRDFVSRLHGYINIMGPNPQGDDPSFVLRRALVLRSMLLRNNDAASLFNSKKELQIDAGVLRALLLISEYKHGTRSMESLLDMSQLKGQSRLDQYALPPRDQLQIHVPADEFLALMQRVSAASEEIELFRSWLQALGYAVQPIPSGRSTTDWGSTGDRPQTPLIRDDEILQLAELAHRCWCAWQQERNLSFAAEEVPGKTHPYLCSFADLPAAFQTLVINRVLQIPVILHDAGLEICDPSAPLDWSDEPMIERLATKVHHAYVDRVEAEVAERQDAGLLPNANQNLTPFGKLPPAKQESNRDFVRTIPRKLARIGLKLKARDPAAAAPSPHSIELIRAKREELAIVEHSRWNWQSLLQKYVYKPGLKSDERRTNPDIQAWDRLLESTREYDRVDPEKFTGLIFQAGFDVV